MAVVSEVAVAEKAPESTAAEVFLPDSELLPAFQFLKTENRLHHPRCYPTVRDPADSTSFLLIQAERRS